MRRLTAQDAAANGHDERRRNAFAGDVGNRNPEVLVVDLDVIEVIAADLTRRHINSTDLKPIYGGCFGGEEDALNVSRDFEVVIETFFFIRFRVDDGVVKREGGLLGDRFEDNEIASA